MKDFVIFSEMRYNWFLNKGLRVFFFFFFREGFLSYYSIKVFVFLKIFLLGILMSLFIDLYSVVVVVMIVIF